MIHGFQQSLPVSLPQSSFSAVVDLGPPERLDWVPLWQVLPPILTGNIKGVLQPTQFAWGGFAPGLEDFWSSGDPADVRNRKDNP